MLNIPDRVVTKATRVQPPTTLHGLPDSQQRPMGGQHRSSRVAQWSLYDPQFMLEITPTLDEVQDFIDRARSDGAPGDALVYGLSGEIVAHWYVADDDFADVPAHLIDRDGDVWIEPTTEGGEWGVVICDRLDPDLARRAGLDRPSPSGYRNLEDIEKRYGLLAF